MKHKMHREKEIQELKTRAAAIRVRLDSLNRGIEQIQKSTRASASSPWKAFVDVEKCAGCGICREICPVGAITVDEYARVETRTCMGCGRCVQECPEQALCLQQALFSASI